MSINAIIGNSLSGLFTNQAALRITGNNIANVNTPGYARQVVSQETVLVGSRAAGVKISEITRVVDRFLEQAAFTATSALSEYTVQREFHDRLQGVLGRPDSQSTLAGRINSLFASIGELSLNAGDNILRQATLNSIQSFADESSRVAQSIQDLRADTNRQIAEQVNKVNDALQRIHQLNPLIIRENILNGELGGLEDQRSQAIAEVADILDVQVNLQPDGSVHVLTETGVVLVDSAVRELEYTAPGTVTAETQFDQIKIYTLDAITGERLSAFQNLDPNLRGGRLRGLIDLRDDQLRDLSLSLGELSASVIDQLNAVHNANASVPPPNSMVGRLAALPSADDHQFTGRAVFAVVDENNQVVATHTVDFDNPGIVSFDDAIADANTGLAGAGTLALTGGVMSFTASNAAHGVVIVQDPAAPSDRAGRGFSHYFGMNDLIEGQVSGRYETGLVGTQINDFGIGEQVTIRLRDGNGTVLAEHTLTIAAGTYDDLLADLNAPGALGNVATFSLDAKGTLQVTPNTGFSDVRISVVNDNTSHFGTGVSFSALFGVGDKYLADAAKNLRVLESVANDPGRLAVAKFDLSAAVGDVALSIGDARGALELGSLETQAFGFNAAGELAAQSVTLGQYAGAFLSNAGLMAERVTTLEADNSAMKTEIEERLSDVSGVNLDEELANMVIYQNSYNAAARLLTTAQELYDALLNAF